MADERDDKPDYKVYRSRRKLLKGKSAEEERFAPPPSGTAPRETRRERPRGMEPLPYTVHRSGRGPGLPKRRGLPGFKRPFTLGRVAWLLTKLAIFWVALSALVFLVSAQLRQGETSDAAGVALDGGGYTLTSPNNILVLGSDARTKETSEPGSRVGGRSRSDSILLVRAGGGASARLSIPRDTIVNIPGSGRNKVNAAYAIGGPALAITTIKEYLGIEIHHVVEVDFENFPALIDALGGIDIRTGCVISRINGGFKNGGFTLRLKSGENHIDGRQALALARTRKNECNPRENDLTRARRQQKILAAMKGRILSPATFIRLPWVSWAAPKAVRSDMAGPNLLGLFAALATSGTPPTRILKPSGGETLPDGGSGLVVAEEEKRAEVARFLGN